jgi:hypothetical protein
MALPIAGNQGQTGKQTGANLGIGLGEYSEILVSPLMGKYYEQNYRGNKYVCSAAGGGVQLAATHLFSTAIASFTPVLAIYNPLTSTVNLVLQKVWCGLTAAPLATATQTGGFFLVGNAGQSITNAQSATPVNAKTLRASGSQAIGVTNVALAGAVGNATLLRPITGDIEVVTATANATAINALLVMEEVAGSIIVPPGGYVGIANGISNAVAGHLVSAGFEWDEVSL